MSRWFDFLHQTNVTPSDLTTNHTTTVNMAGLTWIARQRIRCSAIRTWRAECPAAHQIHHICAKQDLAACILIEHCPEIAYSSLSTANEPEIHNGPIKPPPDAAHRSQRALHQPRNQDTIPAFIPRLQLSYALISSRSRHLLTGV
jgi:hypothetical protein